MNENDFLEQTAADAGITNNVWYVNTIPQVCDRAVHQTVPTACHWMWKTYVLFKCSQVDKWARNGEGAIVEFGRKGYDTNMKRKVQTVTAVDTFRCF